MRSHTAALLCPRTHHYAAYAYKERQGKGIRNNQTLVAVKLQKICKPVGLLHVGGGISTMGSGLVLVAIGLVLVGFSHNGCRRWAASGTGSTQQRCRMCRTADTLTSIEYECDMHVVTIRAAEQKYDSVCQCTCTQTS